VYTVTSSGIDAGFRLRDVDGDGNCEVVVNNKTHKLVFQYDFVSSSWQASSLQIPADSLPVDAQRRSCPGTTCPMKGSTTNTTTIPTTTSTILTTTITTTTTILTTTTTTTTTTTAATVPNTTTTTNFTTTTSTAITTDTPTNVLPLSTTKITTTTKHRLTQNTTKRTTTSKNAFSTTTTRTGTTTNFHGQVTKVVGDFKLMMTTADAHKIAQDPKAKIAFAKALATTVGLPADDIRITAIYIDGVKVPGRRLAEAVVKVDYEILTTSTKVINAVTIKPAALKAAIEKEATAIGAVVTITKLPTLSASKSTVICTTEKKSPVPDEPPRDSTGESILGLKVAHCIGIAIAFASIVAAVGGLALRSRYHGGDRSIIGVAITHQPPSPSPAHALPHAW